MINQTDFVENIDGEQKLGQPMVNFSLILDWATIEFFMLTGFRERTFPGMNGRLRFPVRIDLDNPIYESEQKEKHIDWAARYSQMLVPVDDVCI